jgi:hypothetical protein
MNISSKFENPESDGFEPLTVTIPRAAAITGESRSKVYELIGLGVYEAVKSGARTLVLYQSIKRRMASLPRAKLRAPAPHSSAR